MARDSTSTDVFKDFALLVISSNLKIDSKAYRKAQGKFIVTEFNEYFGEPTKLLNWEKLCSDLGINGPLRSITQCKKVRYTFAKTFNRKDFRIVRANGL
jgi:hypothetical protein